MKKPYQKTLLACFFGYIVQAVVNCFLPLLFVQLQKDYSLSLSKITLLITINFLIQLGMDFLSTRLIDRIGYRTAAVAAHLFAATGLALVTVLPDWLPNPFVGILIAVAFYAAGGGLIEVIISPLVEACPTEHKESTMSLLHSFYCWGQMGVVLLSTVFFFVFGIEGWRILGRLWALLPLANGLFFLRVPIYSLQEEGEVGLSIRQLVTNRLFWVLMLMMLCAGACELTVSQWASTFAEQGLGISKMLGDLAGTMTFAMMMGISRVIYGKYGQRIPLERFMLFSGLLCVASYLCIALVPSPLYGLIGCALCGFSVGILWPGTYSMAAASLRGGGTALFALLALAGDLGCSIGPTIAGFVSGLLNNDLRRGILAATVFPLLLLIGLWLLRRPRAEQ